MKSFLKSRCILASVVLAAVAAICSGRAAAAPATVRDLDPAFVPGLAKLKHAAGFTEDNPNQSSSDWKPDLQLLVGVKAVEGSKSTVAFVQLTTLPLTNSTGQRSPSLRTNDWAWSPTNKAQFITALYPVRVRVFDQAGRQLKGGQTPMAWGMLTNGLLDLCRLSLEICDTQTNAAPGQSPTNRNATDPMRRASSQSARGKSSSRPPADSTGTAGPGPPPPDSNDLMRALGGGLLWMFAMFQDLQTVPTVADVWAKAQCAIRLPSAWAIVTAPIRGISIDLLPRIEEVTLASAGPIYRLPLDLLSGKRNLSHVEILVGEAHGAEMLLAGVRSIRARHPVKPTQEFLAQVLAAGTVREP